MSHGEHEMHVHDGAFPVDAVVQFLRVGIEHGEAGIVITTPANAARIRQALGSLQSKCTFLDAATELTRCCPGPRLDPGRFHDTFATHLRAARTRGNGGVRVCSEVAAVLCARGQHAAAVEVEHLWSLLLQGQSVALLCPFPSEAFVGWGQEVLVALAREHSRQDAPSSRRRPAPAP